MSDIFNSDADFGDFADLFKSIFVIPYESQQSRFIRNDKIVFLYFVLFLHRICSPA